MFGLDRKRFAPGGDAGDAAADADPRVLVEQERAVRERRIVQQFPRQGQNRRVLGGDRQQPRVVFGVLEAR